MKPAPFPPHDLMIYPDDRIVAFGDQGTRRWGDFRREVDRLTATLMSRKAMSWMLCFGDPYHFAVALFSTLNAGRQAVIPGNLQREALKELSGYHDGLIHDGVFGEEQGPWTIQLPQDDALTTMPVEALTLHPEDQKIMLLTSGSTGTPKPVTKSMANLDAEVRVLEELLGTQVDGCRLVSTVSHQHIYGLLFRVLWPLRTGRAFDRSCLAYPEQVVDRCREDTVLISSPAMLKRVVDSARGCSYRAVFSSGGPLSIEAAHACRNLLGKLPTEVFGSTETGGMGWRQQTNAGEPWTLFPGIKAKTNAEGALQILSPFISPQGWFQTSDRCILLGDGRFSLLGRMDRIVKIEEKRVSLPEIEQRLCQLEWIEDAVVMVLGESEKFTLAAVVKPNRAGWKMISELGRGKFWLRLRRELRSWLEPAGIPRRFCAVEEIPANSLGKRVVADLEKLFSRKSGSTDA